MHIAKGEEKEATKLSSKNIHESNATCGRDSKGDKFKCFCYLPSTNSLPVFAPQRQLHPDKFSLKKPLEVALSETISSELNKAYFILLKPLSRGLYMLELQGVTLGEDVDSDDPGLLMEVMEMNEKVNDITSNDELRVIYDDIVTQVDGLTNKISDAFQRDAIDAAKSLLIRFKYFDNVLEKLKQRLPPL